MRRALAGLALAACGRVTAAPTPDAFAPVDDPTITALAPDHSPARGGARIAIVGTDLDPGTQVLVAGQLVPDAIVQDGALTFTAPPGAPDTTVPVIAFNPRGLARAATGLRYHAAPRLDAVTGPVSGTGGATVTLTGAGFARDDAGPPAVTIDGRAVTGVQVVSDEALTFTAPVIAAPPVGRASVGLANTNGAATLLRGYRYTRAGLLTTGDRFLDGLQATTVLHIDPDAADPETAITPLGRVVGRSTIRGLAARGAELWAIVPSLTTGSGEIAALDPFTGLVTGAQPLHLADGSPIHLSGLVAHDGALYASARGCCPTTMTVYAIDPATGLATPASAALAIPSGHHKLATTATGFLRLDGMDRPLHALTLDGGVAPIGAGLGGNPGAYLRGSAAFAGRQYALTSTDPEVGSPDSRVQGLIILDVQAGTFTTRLRLPTHTATSLTATPDGW